MPHIACIQLHERMPKLGDDEAWLAACYRITPRLERVSASCALLDLGSCTDGEAVVVAEYLLHHLAAPGSGRMRAQVRIGIGTSILCAQLALLAPERQAGRQPRAACDEAPIRILVAAEAPAAIQALPVRVLPSLHPAGAVTQKAVERLERYGLRRLEQLARLGEATLRRQFGDNLGMTLAALAAGRDLRPLLPTPRPATLRCRMSFGSGASAPRVLAALAPAAMQIARRLAVEDRQARCLRLALTWQAGGVSAGQIRLRAPAAEARVLTRHLSDLCATLLLAAPVENADGDPLEGPSGLETSIPAPSGASNASTSGAIIERVLIEVGDLVPLVAAQATFWRTAAQRQEAVAQVAETLARRFGGQPQLAHAVCAVPHAIFAAERYHWLPVGPMEKPNGMLSRQRIDLAPGDADADAVMADAVTPWEGVPQRLHWW